VVSCRAVVKIYHGGGVDRLEVVLREPQEKPDKMLNRAPKDAVAVT
jgi:hypothetical protein